MVTSIITYWLLVMMNKWAEIKGVFVKSLMGDGSIVETGKAPEETLVS